MKRKLITDFSCSYVVINGDNNYKLNARYWSADNARSMLVLLHGVVSSSKSMESITAPLAQQGISCLAIDRRGAGLNTQSRGDAPSTDALLKDLHASLQWASLQNLPIHLGGFCWGGNYVVNYLEQYKPDIASMLLITPSFFPAAQIMQQPFVVGESAEATEEPIGLLSACQLFEPTGKPDGFRLCKVSTRMNGCMQSFLRGSWMKFLRLKYPCFMLLAKKDSIVDNDATRRVFERLKVTPKKCIVLDASHDIQCDNPDAAVDSIVQWIEASQPSKTRCDSKVTATV